MISLDDEEDLIIERLAAEEEPPPPRRTINLRPILIGLGVVVLGGGLGTGVYFLSQLDSRDLIAMLDVSDTPKLAMEMPGRDGDAPGGLLTPPGAVKPVSPPGEVPAAVPAETPPAAAEGQPAGIAVMPQTPPPPKAEPPKPEAQKPEAAPPAAFVPATPPAAVAPSVAPSVAAPAVAPPHPAFRPADQAPTFARLPARAAPAQPLPAAPVPDLVHNSSLGPLPVVARDGRQPWQAYARPFDDIQDRPRLAVVVTDLGLDKEATEAAIATLPPEVTLAFSPYAGALDMWVKKARDAGHEVMLGLPAEASGFPARDPGPMGLLSTASAEDNVARLERVLGRAAGYVGVWAPEGPFTASPAVAPVLAQLKERGLLYVGGGAKDESRPPSLAPLAMVEADLFREAIEARLAQAAADAPRQGRVVVLVQPRPLVFDRLLAWMEKLPEQGVALAPASAVVRQGGKS